jgi:prepilin-type N-terminal cleavage/methylation domain-containing protein
VRAARNARPLPRSGFTLVEMLVVVVIIGILAGLITSAVNAARLSAKRAVVVVEINGLQTALAAYKEKFGDYPPDFTDTTLAGPVQRHLAKAFPRYTGNWQNDLTTWFQAVLKAQGDSNAQNDATTIRPLLDPSWALAFWLGGLPDGSLIPNGFSPNPTDPFDTQAAQNYINGVTTTLIPTSGRIGPFFEFELKRLHHPDGNETTASANYTTFITNYFLRYFPKNSNSDSDPYVYFRPNYYSSTSAWTNHAGLVEPATPKSFTLPVHGAIVMPYCEQTQIQHTPSNLNSVFVNPTTFQILCPGLDGMYWNPNTNPATGTAYPTPGNTYPTGDDYTTGQYDDITNFSGGTLKDAQP